MIFGVHRVSKVALGTKFYLILALERQYLAWTHKKPGSGRLGIKYLGLCPALSQDRKT